MTYREAEEKLKEISGDKYRALYYNKTTDSYGNVTTVCQIYTSTENHIDQGNTWEEAFAAREARINPIPRQIQEPPE